MPGELVMPSLLGRRYQLVPLDPSHVPQLYRLSMTTAVSARWRNRGATPSYEAFTNSLYLGVHCQFVITPKAREEAVVGLVAAYNANLSDQVAYLAVLVAPNTTGAAMEGLILFVRYLFAHWSFRRLYAETIEFNLTQFESAVRSGVLVEEARLREHFFFDGAYWDKVVLSVSRETIVTLGPRYFAFLDRGADAEEATSGEGAVGHRPADGR